MLPSIDDTVLQSNPKFAGLHKTLTTTLLNHDGSTKNHPSQAEREATSKELRRLRIRATRRSIIQKSLATLPLTPTSPKQPPLPQDLIELLTLLTQTLATPLSRTQLSLLSSDTLYASLPSHYKNISTLLSTSLTTHALPLARLLSPTTNASFLHRQIPSIPLHLSTLLSTLSQQKLQLSNSRQSLIPLTNNLLTHYRTAITLTIRHIEQTLHGSSSRHVKSTSEYLSLKSQNLAHEAKILEISAGNAVYGGKGEGVREALARYGEHLRDGRARLKQRERDARRELERYGVGREGEEWWRRERTLREVARVYGEMLDEVSEVRREVERLKIS